MVLGRLMLASTSIDVKKQSVEVQAGRAAHRRRIARKRRAVNAVKYAIPACIAASMARQSRLGPHPVAAA